MKIIIDDQEIEVTEGSSVLDIALEKGIYIPHLCSHPEVDCLQPVLSDRYVYQGEHLFEGEEGMEYGGCNLCIVEIEGREGFQQACRTPVENGMRVVTDSERIREARKDEIAGILRRHPHACLVCAQADGCDRKLCSMHIPEQERCCFKFGACELQKVAEYVGIEKGLPPYEPLKFFSVDDDPVLKRDYRLCIGCLRCVRVCKEVKGIGALAFTNIDSQVVVGSKAASLRESGCKFCGMCVEVCPTGALRYAYTSKKPKKRSKIKAPVLPPERRAVLSKENIQDITEAEGIYVLYDEGKEIYKISGVENIRQALLEEIEGGSPARYFDFEEDPMFTAKERQLTQQYMKKTGGMPPGNSELDDLF